MSDQIGRHTSTRWVKASVPSYGDDWDDEYASDEENIQKTVIPQRFELPVQKEEDEEELNLDHLLHNDNHLDKEEFDVDQLHEPYTDPQPNLVLSVDRLRTREYDSSSDEEEHEVPVQKSATTRKKPAPLEDLLPNVVTSRVPEYEKIVPPTPTYSENYATPDTPMSDKSYSDADSIQHEPVNLNLATFPKGYVGKSVLDDVHNEEETINSRIHSRKSSVDSEPFANVPVPIVNIVPPVIHVTEHITPVSTLSAPPVLAQPSATSQNEPSRFAVKETSEEELSHFNAEPSPFEDDKPPHDADSEAFYSPSHSRESSDPRFVEASPASNTFVPLVLSIDNRNDSDSSDDDWGYHSQSSSVKLEAVAKDHQGTTEVPNEYTTTDDSDNDSDDSFEKSGADYLRQKPKHHPDQTDALDSLINDLERASHATENTNSPSATTQSTPHTHYKLPDDDDGDDSSLGDFADYNNYEKNLNLNTSTDQLDTTPIAPLSVAQTQSGHESFMLGQRNSIRKPPPKRSELVSVDYTNIAEAMSGYLTERDAIETVEEESENDQVVSEHEDNEANDTDHDPTAKQDLALKPVISLGSVSTGRASIDTTTRDVSQSSRAPSAIPAHVLNATPALPSIPAQSPTASQFIGHSNGDFRPPTLGESSRRVLTMSTGTFNMGGWDPSTNNFRDQFINDNDNESAINFNVLLLHKDDYEKFTNSRSSLGQETYNTSDLSIPGTIDAQLPSILESPDFGDSSEVLSKLISNMDSVLGKHDYGPTFREERLTPATTNIEGVQQKYSSLLSSSTNATLLESVDSPLGASSDLTRATSDSSAGSENTIQAGDSKVGSVSSAQTEKPLYVPKQKQQNQTYPVSDWKKIMATSQPRDRISLLKEALASESAYNSGLQNWLHETLKLSENGSNMHIGRIASQAYQNAQHNDIRRHNSLRSKVSNVKDKVEISGLLASSFFGKRLLNKGKKLMKSSD